MIHDDLIWSLWDAIPLYFLHEFVSPSTTDWAYMVVNVQTVRTDVLRHSYHSHLVSICTLNDILQWIKLIVSFAHWCLLYSSALSSFIHFAFLLMRCFVILIFLLCICISFHPTKYLKKNKWVVWLISSWWSLSYSLWLMIILLWTMVCIYLVWSK